MNNPQQPREYDAVLGGNSPSLEGAAVLGGIDGVKLRLKNPDAKVRIAALEQALNYGEQGLDLVIAGLKDKSVEVQDAAYWLLKPLLLILFNPPLYPLPLEKVSEQVHNNNYSFLNAQTQARVRQALREFDANLRLGRLTDYTRLRDYLAQGKWAEANSETNWVMRLMLAVVTREKEGWLDAESIDEDECFFLDSEIIAELPCQDLRTIDQLWVKYSNRRFGFSVQKRIYQSLRGTRNQTTWEAFAEQVRWSRGVSQWELRDITFDITAPEGHLPLPFWINSINSIIDFEVFLSRIKTCKL
ncbi:MAG: GUN4 domain-containing protein [Sphaerospermopsis sp.]|nr:GUN4 domain-containing protein [Sphaerospermopsis sp.]